MKSPFWLKISNDDNKSDVSSITKNSNTATTTGANSIITHPVHIQSTEEEKLSIVRRSQMIMNNSNNTTNNRSTSPLRRRKARTKVKTKIQTRSEDKYQMIQSNVSNLSSSSFQSEISDASVDSHYELQSNYSDLLDDNNKTPLVSNQINVVDSAMTHTINPSFSEDNYNIRYEVDGNEESKDEKNATNNNNTMLSVQRREELLKAARKASCHHHQKCKEEKKSDIDIACKQARSWKCIHDEMMTNQNKNDPKKDYDSDCSLTLTHILELDNNNSNPIISETSYGIEISTSNLDLLELRDEEIREEDDPVSDTSSISSSTTCSTSSIKSCLREPKIWNNKSLQSKNSSDGEYMFDLGEEYESLIMFEERSRSVKFSASFDIRECPSVEAEHKPVLFYTPDEMYRFRQDYYREVDAAHSDGQMNAFDSIMESIDSFLCNSQPCGRYKKSEEQSDEA